MSKPFDATMRELFELEPAAWLEFLGFPVPDPSQVKVIDSNVSTFTAEADKVVRVGGPEPLIVHTEFLSGRDLAQPEQALWYKLWTATAILIGLRYPREQVGEMMEGVSTLVLGIRGIEESWVYQDIFAEGEARGEAKGEAKGHAEEAMEALLRLGRRKLGPPGAEVEARIAALGDLDRLRELLDRVLDVASGDELLGPPGQNWPAPQNLVQS
jgi:predicted transposase YdaD